jgi:hypothetical protein
MIILGSSSGRREIFLIICNKQRTRMRILTFL